MTQSQLQAQETAPRRSEASIAGADARALMRIVWDYQEERRLGWITIHGLQEASGLPWPRFTQALDVLLESPRIVQTKSGGLEYTW